MEKGASEIKNFISALSIASTARSYRRHRESEFPPTRRLSAISISDQEISRAQLALTEEGVPPGIGVFLLACFSPPTEELNDFACYKE